MIDAQSEALRPPLAMLPGFAALRQRSHWIVAFGALLIALGAWALGSVVAATIFTVYFVAISMIAAGVAEIAIGFRAKSYGRLFIWMVLGLVYAIAGMSALANPLLAAGILTLTLGAALCATGVLRIVLAFQMKTGSAWAWVAISGAITFFLGAAILSQWPVSSLYILGVFLSVDLIFCGAGWVSFGLGLSQHRQAP